MDKEERLEKTAMLNLEDVKRKYNWYENVFINSVDEELCDEYPLPLSLEDEPLLVVLN